MKHIRTELKGQNSLFEFFKSESSSIENVVYFESKAFHESNYQSYLMMDYHFKVEIYNSKMHIIIQDDFAKKMISDFITDNNLHYVEYYNQIIIEHDETKPFTSQKDLIENHPFFNLLRQFIHSCKQLNVIDLQFIFPMIFSYDLIDQFYPLEEFELKTIPDVQFYFPKELFIEDQINHQIQHIRFHDITRNIQSTSFSVEKPGSISESNKTDHDYHSDIEQAKSYISTGDVYQLVVSRDYTIECDNPFTAYEILRELNPSPYMFFVKDQDHYLFGASPERAVQFDSKTQRVKTSPIAGTRARAFNRNGTINIDLDNKRALELKLDQKEIAEHIMLVDLARNDIASISKPGTREVTRLMEIETFSHVLHLVSEVEGDVRDELDAFHVYQALMNMGTLTGSPKFRAYQLLREIEKKPRGYYGGSIGFLSANGDLSTAIIIRSAYVENGIATITAGAGVVYNSISDLEVQESKNKAAAVLTAIRQSNKKEMEVVLD